MRPTLSATLLLAALAATPALGQTTAPADDPLRVDQARVAEALRSPDAFLAFVTAPETRWADRTAAVTRAYPAGADRILAVPEKLLPRDSALAPAPARFVLPASYLARVRAMHAEMEREHWEHRFAITPEFPEVHAYLAQPRPPGDTLRRERTILGHPWTVPAARVTYPATPEEAARAPWPWQVHRMMLALWLGLRSATPADELHAAVLALPCGTEEEQRVFLTEAAAYAHRTRAVTPEIMGALRNLGLRPPARAIDALQGVRLSPADEAFWMGEAVMVDLAERVADGHLSSLAFHLPDLLDGPSYGDGPIRRPDRPYAAFLALGRRIDAMDPALHWTERGYAAEYYLRAADPAFFATVPRETLSDSTEFEELARAFRRWFAAHRAELEAKAAPHAEPLAAHRARLEKVAVCRAGPAQAGATSAPLLRRAPGLDAGGRVVPVTLPARRAVGARFGP
jgi:hypothetical protein